MTNTCETCRFAEPVILEQGPVVRCHRNPPATLEEPLPEIETLEGEVVSTTITFDRYPIVRSDDWCGEWSTEGPVDFTGVTVQQVLPGSIVTMPFDESLTAEQQDDIVMSISRAAGHDEFTIIWVGR